MNLEKLLSELEQARLKAAESYSPEDYGDHEYNIRILRLIQAARVMREALEYIEETAKHISEVAPRIEIIKTKRAVLDAADKICGGGDV